VPLLRFNSHYLLLESLAVIREDSSSNIERMETNEHLVQSYARGVDIDFL